MRGGEAREGISFPSLVWSSSHAQTASQHTPHRYVDRVTELLQQKLKQSQLLALKKDLMVEKQQEALQEQAALEPKLDLLLEKTRELQKLVRLTRSLPVHSTERGPVPACPLPAHSALFLSD